MTRALAAAALVALTATAALAQPPKPATESVTVTGTKDRQAIRGFVESFTTTSRITGKIARWQDGVCPITVGLKPAFAKFISQHIRDVASRVGAPVSPGVNCKPNIEIVFTTTPQALLDNVRAHHQLYLGYHDNSRQADQLAKITHPMQAWYTTVTVDADGVSKIDNTSSGPCHETCIGLFKEKIAASGRLGDGYRAGFYHVIIAVDPDSLMQYEIGSLADYIALLALSQITSLDTCQTLPSIANLLTPNCPAKADTLTGNDLAWLKGLYKMSPAATLNVQQDEVSYQMQQSLEGKQ